MTNVIDHNEIFKKYDFSSVITEEDTDQAITIIKNIIDSGNYFKNSPRYQTKENIFARPEPIWLKFRMSFLFSVFMYLGREAKVADMMAWSFMTNLETAEDRDNLWHTHWHPKTPNSKIMSGIWYLKVPEDVPEYNLCGTEMAPNGPEEEGKYYVKPTLGHWLIYPGDQWHRPGIVQSDEYRFVLAADIEYI